MSIRKRPDTAFYWYEFERAGKRFQGSTGVTTKREARVVELAVKEEVRKAAALESVVGRTDRSIRLGDAARRYYGEVKDKLAGARDVHRDLMWLSTHFGDDKLLSNITDEDVAKMVATRRKNRAVHARATRKPETYPFVSPQTVNHTTVRLQALFTHIKENWKDDKKANIRFAHEPIWHKHKLDVPRNTVRLLDDNERKRLDATLHEDFGDFEPVIGFAGATALRFMSCVTLQWSEVHWKDGVILKPGKRKPGGKEKIERVPITDRVREILEPLIGHHPDYVFTYVAKRARYGHIIGQRYPLTAGGTASVWNRLCKKAGVKKFGFHGLRRERATKVWRATKNIVAVSRLLNHGSVETTMRYIGADDRDVAEAMQQTELVAAQHRVTTEGHHRTGKKRKKRSVEIA